MAVEFRLCKSSNDPNVLVLAFLSFIPPRCILRYTMEADISLPGEERMLHKISATRKNDTMRSGELVCTTKRLVYKEDSDARLDISTSMISAVEYEPKSLIDSYYFAFAIFAFIISAGMPLIGHTTTGNIGDIPTLVMYVGFAIGIIFGAIAILLLSHTLTVYTPSQSFVFTSSSRDELKDIIDAVHQSQ